MTRPDSLSATEILNTAQTVILLRRIWLPRVVYEALPFVYLIAGLAAFLATLYVPEWYWIVPWYVLFACALVHAAIYLLLRRLRSRARHLT
ncbi:MAG: hypothetical protein AAGC71_06790 [Pseudomonadota bacterium]